MSTFIHDIVVLSGSAGLMPSVGEDWTVAGGQLAAIEEPVAVTTADPTFLSVGDTLSVGGVTYSLTAMTGHAVDVTYSTGAGQTVLLTKMAVMELTDPVGGGVVHVAVFPDGVGDLTEIETIRFVDVNLDPSDGGIGATDIELTEIDSDNEVTLASTTAPDGVVNGTDAGETMTVGFVDAEGDEITHAGNVIEAGNGADTIVAGNGDDTIDGGAGADDIRGDGGNDVIDGGSGGDTITLITGDGNDTIDGGDDADTIYVHGGGAHVIAGGEGGTDTDTLAVYSGTTDVSVTFTGDEAGTVTMGATSATFTEIESVATGSGDDTLDASAGSADMTLSAGSGNDLLVGGSGDDRLYAGIGSDTVEGGQGNDSINLSGNPMEIDHVVMSDGDGNDTVSGFEMPLASGAGWIGLDQLDVSGLTNAGGDPVTTADVTVSDDGTGNAVLTFPNGESITLSGVAPAAISSADVLVAMGIPAAPVVTPDGIVHGTAGVDVMGVGHTDAQGDVIDHSGNHIQAGGEADQVTAGDGDDLIEGGDGWDILQGSGGNDTLLGEAGDDILSGGAGNDSLDGGAGYNTLNGNEGNDTLIAGTGFSQIRGGDDRDTVVLQNSGFSDIEGGEGGDDWDHIDGSGVSGNMAVTFSGNEAGSGTVNGLSHIDFAEIEQITTGSGNDSVDASATTDGVTVDTGAGEDTLIGGTGNDTLTAGTGADAINGGAGDDLIHLANDGDADTVVMGNGDGNDTITGFDMPVDNGDGTFTTVDILDLSGLTDAGGDPVDADDITVGDDGAGNAVLSFPNGESITLVGVAPASITPDVLTAMGVPAAPGAGDGTVDGTAGDDAMDVGFTDAQGDQIDGADGDDDTIRAGAGNDTINAGAGSNTVHGEAGSDHFELDDETYATTIIGGDEGGDVDVLDAGAATQDTAITYTGLESGTATIGMSGTATFTEIEELITGAGNDTIDASASGAGINVYTHDGNDLVIGSDHDDVITTSDGQDTVDAGAGDDTTDLYNDGFADTVVFGDGDGHDTVHGFDMPIDNGDGTYTPVDLLDLGGMTDAGGDPVDGDDITVGTDGSGNAVLSFPNGESITLVGVAPAAITPDVLTAMGVPPGAGVTPDGVVDGTGAGDAIVPGYVDAQGDALNDSGNSIAAGAGNDTVVAGSGADSIVAGEGADLAQGNGGADTIAGDDGDINNDAVAGGQDDTLQGGAGNDVLYGEGGNDLLYGGTEDDNLSGSLGNDTLLGESGNDTLAGGEGSDLLVGEAGNDYMWGDANLSGAADTMVGGTGADTMFGGYGDDQFSVEDGHGADILVGGELDEISGDHLNASWVTADTTLTFTGTEDGTLASGGETLSFAQIEQVTTGSGNDTVDASAATGGVTVATGAGNDQVTGGIGDDTLTTGTGADTVTGGEGDDLIHLGGDGEGDVIVMGDGHGNDTLTGFDMPVDNGDGTFTPVDVIDVSGLTTFGGDPIDTDDIVVDDDGAGNAVLYFPMGESITLMGVDPFAVTPAVLTAMGVPAGTADGIVQGTGGADAIGAGYVDADGDEIDDTGNWIESGAGNDDIDAGEGGDKIHAGAGADTVHGNGGDDQIFGDDDNDLMHGDAGHDSLWGGLGDDTLFGDDGDDKLVGNEDDDLLIGGDGNDLFYGDGVFGDNGGMAPGDAPEAGFGNDTMQLDGGDDSAYGGSGDDTFVIYDGFGNHLIVGGETGETLGDRIDGSGLTGDVQVVLTGDEAGTIDGDGADPASPVVTFAEIERLDLGAGNDTVVVQTAQTMTVNGSDGFDTLELPVAAPGDPAPVVTVTSESPFPGVPGATTKTGYVDFPDGSRMYFENFEEIICFTPGTLIDTLRGRVAVETLVAGDKVLTRDHGYQPLAWTGRRDLSADEIARCPSAAPIRIAAGALGKGLPERDLLVSPRHRMLIAGARAELMFGEREVLVAAADLLGLPGVTQEVAGPVSYIHVMCDAHQIIRAEGAWSESFQPAEAVLNALDAATRAELLGLFPELATARGLAGFDAARPVLSASEARALLAA